MKLLFFVHTLRGGGVENVLLNILNKLPKEVDVTVLVWRKEGNAIELLPKNVRLKYLLKGNEFLSKNILIQNFQKIWRLVLVNIYRFFPFLIRKKAGNDYDREIIFYHGLVKEWSSIRKPNSIIWIHGMLTNLDGNVDDASQINEIAKYDTIICVSEAIKKTASKYSKEFGQKAIVIYNPIDRELILEKSQMPIFWNFDVPTFVSVGRLTRLKGFYPMMDIHKKMLAEGFNHKIIVVGTGEDEDEMRRLVKEKNIEESYIIMGHQKNPYPYIKNGDFFFLFSETEGYPLVVEEAKILSKPMIVTNVGGIPEIVENEKTALIINRNDEEMHLAMKRFLTDQNLIKMLSENCKKSSEHYDEKGIYDEILKIIL